MTACVELLYLLKLCKETYKNKPKHPFYDIILLFTE